MLIADKASPAPSSRSKRWDRATVAWTQPPNLPAGYTWDHATRDERVSDDRSRGDDGRNAEGPRGFDSRAFRKRAAQTPAVQGYLPLNGRETSCRHTSDTLFAPDAARRSIGRVSPAGKPPFCYLGTSPSWNNTAIR